MWKDPRTFRRRDRADDEVSVASQGQRRKKKKTAKQHYVAKWKRAGARKKDIDARDAMFVDAINDSQAQIEAIDEVSSPPARSSNAMISPRASPPAPHLAQVRYGFLVEAARSGTPSQFAKILSDMREAHARELAKVRAEERATFEEWMMTLRGVAPAPPAAAPAQ